MIFHKDKIDEVKVTNDTVIVYVNEPSKLHTLEVEEITNRALELTIYIARMPHVSSDSIIQRLTERFG